MASTKQKTISPVAAIDAAVKLASGSGRRPVMATHDISQRDVENLRRLSGLSVAQFQSALRQRLMEIEGMLVEEIAKRIPEIPAGQLAMTFGILHDKRAGIETEPLTQQVIHDTQQKEAKRTRAELLAIMGIVEKPAIEVISRSE